MIRIILSNQYSYRRTEDGGEEFCTPTSLVRIPPQPYITLRHLLLHSYQYKVLEDGSEEFRSMDHTIIVPPILNRIS
jgi:hypothetical protein